jgi:deoxynucleoside triphosphate triphosphohydrolase SAMHD1
MNFHMLTIAIEMQGETQWTQNYSQEGILSEADEIYGEIELSQQIYDITKTIEFERMKRIRQLGGIEFIDERASHSRFEHSIGTYHKACTMIDSLLGNYNNVVTEWDENILNWVKIAALTHDIGHGPFSHTFDNGFIQKKYPSLGWTHEQSSTNVIDHMIDNNNIDLGSEEIDLIQSLIMGTPFSDSVAKDIYSGNSIFGANYAWIFEIGNSLIDSLVSNKRNSIDVDKLDYLKRDATRMGLFDYWFDSEPLERSARIIEGKICYPTTMMKEIHKLFDLRKNMFEKVYVSKDNLSVDIMIWDIFHESDEFYNFKEMISNMDSYIKLTDEISKNKLTNIKKCSFH